MVSYWSFVFIVIQCFGFFNLHLSEHVAEAERAGILCEHALPSLLLWHSMLSWPDSHVCLSLFLDSLFESTALLPRQYKLFWLLKLQNMSLIIPIPIFIIPTFLFLHINFSRWDIIIILVELPCTCRKKILFNNNANKY